MANVKDNVKEYYGKVLKTNEDFKTSLTSTCTRVNKVPKQVKEALDLCHEEVISRYYGCGPVFPEAMPGLNVLDFGSGAGRDCFILSKLVGEDGFVTGIDMTEELVNIAKRYIPYHMEKFGFSKANVDFKLGYIEYLNEVGIAADSCDLIVSNCVIDLCPDKPAVFKEAFRVLKEGGEIYFSDMYTDREQPQNVRDHKDLWGEGFGGALHWKSFVDLVKEIGFSGPYLVSSQNITCDNEELAKLLGDSKFVAATYRLFKPGKMKNEKMKNEKCCCYIKYKGTMNESPEVFKFDKKHTFDFNSQKVSTSEVVNVLKNSRYSQHLDFKDAESTCFTPCGITHSVDPFEQANTCTVDPQ